MRAAAILVVAAALASGGCGSDGGRGGGPTSTTVATSGTTSTTAVAAGPRFDPPVLLGELADEALGESSGLAASRRTPGVFWTHNDSGDDPLVYCLTRQAARCGTWRVTGARARDWEDMAAGPGPAAGERYLYLGDIGDNNLMRDEVVVYRVVEPAASGTAVAAGAPVQATAPAEALRLRYEDGSHDAEALLVHPVTGTVYVVTKGEADGAVYKADLSRGVLAKVAPLQFGFLELVTGGDISPDGRRAVVCTYLRGFELTLPEGEADFDRIWTQRAQAVSLAPRAQGEAIAYRLDGAALLTTSEKSPMPLHEVVRR